MNTYVTLKILKIRKTWEICISILWKIHIKNMLLRILKILLRGAKVFVFQQDQINYHHRSSQRSYLAQTLIKTLKHNHNSSIILWLLKNRSKNKKTQNKIGLPPNKRYWFTPLARHDDLNDAHIKDKNLNIMGASWSILLAHLSLTHFLCIGILWANNLWEQELTSIGRQNKHNFKTFNT